MTTTTGLIFRDGLEADIAPCLKLDHSYQTDFVWQVSMMEAPQQRSITIREDRLPRTMDAHHPSSENRLKAALSDDHAYIVVTSPDHKTHYGYLVMLCDPTHQTAAIHDVVIDIDVRHRGIATRLVRIAQRWATQKQLSRLFIETQTKNYPSIQMIQKMGYVFCGFNDQYFENRDIAIFFSKTLN
jgi:ribosomal protein S18 acetylase RimI-like enzyme